MDKKRIVVSGTGCALADYLYTSVQFNNYRFTKYISKTVGDGGLSPGKLVFTEELEMFANKPYSEILIDICGSNIPDSFNIGGPSLVSLLHASQMLSPESFEVRFHGNAGTDGTAAKIVEILDQTLLNIENYKQIGSKATSFTDVFSDQTFDNGNGERTFVNNIGAAWDYSPAMLTDDFFDADIVCFGGTALVPQIHDNLTALLQKAKNNGCITIVNTVYDFRNEKENSGKPWPLGNTEESFRLIDLLIMDKEEALKISGKTCSEDAVAYFMSLNVATIVITNGNSNIYVFSNGQLFEPMNISQFPVSNRVTSDVRFQGDTTGCGDNFAGGFIAAIAQQSALKKRGQFDLIDALSWAIASGGFACSYLGGAYFEKYLGEKRKLIGDYQRDYLVQIAIAED